MSNIPYESAVPGAGKFYRFQRALPGGRASLALWGFIAGIGALDYTWATQQAIGIDPAQIDARIRLGLIILAFVIGLRVLPFRQLASVADRLAVLATTILRVSLFTGVAGVLSYLAMTTNAPLADALFLAADRALGVNYESWHAFVVSHSMLEVALGYAYAGTLFAVVASLAYFPLTGQFASSERFQWALAISAVTAIAISAVMPAFGPWHDFGLAQPEGFADMLALRAGSMRQIGAVAGIISFPSFHTSLGVLIMYYLWTSRRLRWPALLINIPMLVSVWTQGNHYFVDSLGGIAVAAMAIWIARAIVAVPVDELR
jgi:hypothetical protein